MKVKCDFVTNSSSCSFVMVGIKMDYDTMKEKFGEDFEKLPKGITYISEPDCIGKFLVRGSSDDYGIDENEISFKELRDDFDFVSRSLDIDISELKLITGVRNC